MADTTAHRWHRPWVAAAAVTLMAAVWAIAFTGLPRETAKLPAIARHAMQIALPRWGTTETVSEVVYGSRGFDTFGETFLLLAAVVTVALLSRGREARSEYVGESSAGRREQREVDGAGGGAERPGGEESGARTAEAEEDDDAPPADPDEDPAPHDADDDPLGERAPERAVGMTVIVRIAARVAAVPLAITAVYLAAWGYTPGGGFPAGAAVTGVAVLLYAALGHRAVRGVVRPSVLEPVELVGAALIVTIGVGGLVDGHEFLSNWVPLAPQQTIRASGTLQLFSGAELIEVATGLTIAIFALLGMRHEWTDDEDDGDGDGEGSDGASDAEPDGAEGAAESAS